MQPQFKRRCKKKRKGAEWANYKGVKTMGNFAVGAMMFGVAGILFMLGLISLQVGMTQKYSWATSAFVMLAFVGCLLISGYMVMIGLALTGGMGIM